MPSNIERFQPKWLINIENFTVSSASPIRTVRHDFSPSSSQSALDMTTHYTRELDIACTAVQHCAVLTQRLQHDTLSKDGQIQKSDFSPVTIGDFAAQALLTSATHGVFKDDRFLAEESADDLRSNTSLLNQVWSLVKSVAPAFEQTSLTTPSSKEEVLDLIDAGGKNTNSKDGRLWVFDPIDGTATFLQGKQYAINCAFLVDGREEIGIIGCPNVLIESDTISENTVDNGLGVMIFAVRGQGTWMRPMQSNGILAPARRIPRHGDDAKLESLRWSDCSTYTSTILPLHQQVAARLGTSFPGVDLFSSLMKYAALGLGRSDLVVRIFKYTSWRSNMYVSSL